MSDSPVFTVAEANKRLPLVSVIVKDLSDLSRTVADRRHRIEQLASPTVKKPDTDPYAQERKQILEDLEENVRDLQRYEEELDQLGVWCRDHVDGVVIFPAEIDGNPIHLSWRLGEPEVLYWHNIDEGFNDRRPLPVSVE